MTLKQLHLLQLQPALSSLKIFIGFLGGQPKKNMIKLFLSKFKKNIIKCYLIGKNINFFKKQIKGSN